MAISGTTKMEDILTPARLGWAMGIVALSLLVTFLQRLHYHRSLVKGLPGPPHSYLFGHIWSMGAAMATQPRRAAPQTLPVILQEKYKLGDYFYVDAWPLNPDPIMMISDPDLMQQFTVRQNLPKHYVVVDFVKHLGGPGNLVSSDGQEWKKWRSAFNPGFSASHLMTLVPLIVDECDYFCKVMVEHAEKNEVFRMERDATKLTVDVVGKVVLDFPLDSQKGPNELVDAFLRQVKCQPMGAQFNPIEIVDWPIRAIKQVYNTWVMDRYLARRIEERFATRSSRGKSKAIIDLALDAYLKEVKGVSGDDAAAKVTTLDSEFKTAAISNMKIFIFAGHDTTSSTIAYAYYYFFKHPDVMAKVRAEHDQVFGSDPSTVAAQLKQDAHLLNRLEYTLAVMREVLRLQPPASTIRQGRKGFFLHEPNTGESLPTEGFMLWPVDVGLHRNAKYWPDPHAFRPERHLSTGTADSSANYNSKDAWVAFSKGSRNCIGQELAVIETKVILAMTLRTFDFIPAYHELDLLKGDGSGYPSDMSGIQTQFGDEAYQIQLGTAKPREGMPCRARLRK